MNKKLFCLMLILVLFSQAFAQIDECDTSDALITKNDNLNKTYLTTGELFQVPVIFHVLWNINAENIADSNIQAMITSLNADFMSLNADYRSVPEVFTNAAGNPNISFVLANTLPDGKPTNGIMRTKTGIKIFSGANAHAMFKESKIIAPDRYLNVYIVD